MIRRCRYFCASLLLVKLSLQQNAMTIEGAFGLAADSASWLATVTGITENCPLVEGITDALNASLPFVIRGQQGGIESVLNAFSAWEFSRKSGSSGPLVLAIVGPTGVGKSETGFRIADAIFSKKTRVGHSRKFIPNGLLALRGEDFSVDSEAAAIGIGEIHRRIRSRVIDHLRKCAGNALIIFDEVQKVAPGALEALMPGLRERGSFSTSSIIKNILGKPVEIHEELSTANCIFIFISDIGADKTESQLLYYGDRNKIPQSALRSAVKGALDEQWKRLNFGTTVKEVIPFLSMEKEQIEEVFRLKLQGIAEENRNIFWADLIVDHSVVDYLSGPEFIRYRHLSQRFPIPAVVNEETDDDLESTDPGSNSTSVPPQQYVTRTKTFATMGGRSLENAGPLHDLQAMLFRTMRPWQTDKILHIGLTDSASQRRKQKQRRTSQPADKTIKTLEIDMTVDGDSQKQSQDDSAQRGVNAVKKSGKKITRPEVLFQWCTVEIGLKFDEGSMNNFVFNDDSCETVWFGEFPR